MHIIFRCNFYANAAIAFDAKFFVNLFCDNYFVCQYLLILIGWFIIIVFIKFKAVSVLGQHDTAFGLKFTGRYSEYV